MCHSLTTSGYETHLLAFLTYLCWFYHSVPHLHPSKLSEASYWLLSRQATVSQLVVPGSSQQVQALPFTGSSPCLENRRLQGDLTAAFQYLSGAYRKDGEGLFTRVCSDRTRGNGSKLKEGRFRLDLRKKFFTMRVVKHLNRLPREIVNAPSLEVFKARMDGTLSNLVWWKMSLLMAGGLEPDDL